MTAILSAGVLRCAAWWEVKKQGVFEVARLILLALALVVAAMLTAVAPAAERAVEYFSHRHPLWWFAAMANSVERSTRDMPWWFQAVVLLVVALPLALVVAVATTLALVLAFVVSEAGRATEDRWLPRLAEAWRK